MSPLSDTAEGRLTQIWRSESGQVRGIIALTGSSGYEHC
jgi:hypothetical protein